MSDDVPMISRLRITFVAILLSGCVRPAEIRPHVEVPPLPAVNPAVPRSPSPTDGRVAPPQEAFSPLIVSGQRPDGVPGSPGAAAQGDISLDFADTDIREVVAEILGRQLAVNYIIDPAVRGTTTLRTAQPLARSQLLPVLKTILAQNGANLVETDGFYRVMPSAGAGGAASVLAGTTVVPLRYAIAEDLARVLQPFVGPGGRIVAEPGRNAVVIASEADTRETLVGLAKSFDVDMLAGQSYALFPVVSGGVKDFAAALLDAFRSPQGSPEGPRGGSLASFVRVVPMERINALLVVSAQARYIEEARRVYAVVNRAQRQTLRSWHVTYLRNSDLIDTAYTLQSALTPNAITVTPRAQAGSPFASSGSTGQHSQSSPGGGVPPGQGIMGGAAAAPAATQQLGSSPGPQSSQQQTATGQQQAPSPNPLLGGLDPLGGASVAVLDTLRIVPNEQNNALLTYATAQEQDLITAMLRKIDILPRQVRIDATIAEVTLNDQLQYGTQFFFRSGGINGALSYSNAAIADPRQPALTSQFPGFFLGGSGAGGAPIALNALQSVTSVNVLSSPQLMVVDNQVARLQVGNMVPYLSQTAQSTVSSGAPVINSINYQQTGVIMQIRPRINSGGVVTLDISQEVSDVNTDPTIATTGITSPIFLERNVSSRVVVQDGQTIGLAGLIRDNSSRGNEGLPWLKDVPLFGLLAGKQDNSRARTELLILITPHVIEDHRDARALTEDRREQLGAAAAGPQILGRQVPSGSNDPGAPLRKPLSRAP